MASFIKLHQISSIDSRTLGRILLYVLILSSIKPLSPLAEAKMAGPLLNLEVMIRHKYTASVCLSSAGRGGQRT